MYQGSVFLETQFTAGFGLDRKYPAVCCY